MSLIKDFESNECNAYLHFDPLYRLADLLHPERVDNLQMNGKQIQMRFISSNMSDCGGFSQFCKQVEEYCTKHERKCEGGGKQRLGWIYDLMLPEGEYTEMTLKRLVRKYWKYVVGKEKNLRYAAWAYEIPHKKKLKMVRIWIYDREYFLHKEKYLRNVWLDPEGKVCRKGTEGAVLKARKGDVIPGREVVYFKRTKSRIFEFVITGFENKRSFYKNCWVQALQAVTNTKVVKGRYFPRLSLKKAGNRFLRRIIVAGNQARQQIQNELLNRMNSVKLEAPLSYRDWIIDHSAGVQSDGGTMGGIKMTILNDLFDKYAAIFRNNKFTWKDEEYKLTGIRCDSAEKNCIKLMDMFWQDMSNVSVELQLLG